VIQWGLTPPSEALNPSYHPPPAFLHTILSKNRPGLQPSKVFSHIRHPRLDSIREPSLVRIPYDFTGSCFSVEIKGPDGELEGSVMDGQGLVEDELKNVVGKEFWGELEKISEEFVRINH
jgi:alpha 1,2-mannosyltransferase